MSKVCFLLIVLSFFPYFDLTAQIPSFNNFPVLKGPYFGQKPPGKTPELFAPGIISTDKNEHSYAAFSNDGKEFFWSIMTGREFNGNILLHSKETSEGWTKPEIFEDSKIYNEGVPCFSHDNMRLYFHSDRPTQNGKKGDFNIWYLEKNDNGWSKPILMSFFPNTKENWEIFICQINDGSFYYTRNNAKTSSSVDFGLAKAPYIEGKYLEPSLLDQPFNDGNLNWTPFVDPDEKYIIFSSNRNSPNAGINGCDLFISYHKTNGVWTEPISMGPNINKDGIIERFPQITMDKKYLFFIRGFGDFYWLDAEIINDLRRQVMGE